MRALIGLAVLVGVSACGGMEDRRAAAAAPPAEAEQPVEYCGGDMPVGTMDAYFARLARHLSTSSEPVPLSFYDDHIGILEDGREVWFRTADMGPQARRLPSLEDWREISRRGAKSVHGAGYRGCFLSSGKAAFQAGFDGEFGLSSFDKDRPWTAD
ncbi:MAG: hypothetical protein EON90_13070 [Brevundimonas sp.]|nr:MAG: hypothetical protein EON90_13070 [Brevundimonas sp.]